MQKKEVVIKLLEENRGSSISGGELARTLGVTRAAVHKIISQLRREGFMIDAAAGRGYLLREESDVISAEGIRRYLNAPGREIRVFSSTSSTNDEAKKMASEGLPGGSLAVAAEQRSGRGRSGRSFFSPSGTGAYMSLLLRPDTAPEESVFITVRAAVAVCRAVSALTGLKPQIKWVNDIYINGKKLCGILTEAALEVENGRMDYAVLGIGINCAAPEGGYPGELAGKAISIQEAAPGEPFVRRSQLIAEVVNQLERLEKENQDSWLTEYRSRSLVVGKKVVVLSGPYQGEARAVGIDERARLEVRLEDGRVVPLDSGEVSVLPV